MIQKTWKCLVVFDDSWTDAAWESIKHAFPTRHEGGNKILPTTRNIDVALQIGPDGLHHQPRLLSEDESWDLLRRKALRDRYDEEHNMKQDQNQEELGKKMVKSCGGLPLAVIVLGGILSAKKRLREWEAVYHNIKSYIWRGKSIGESKGEVQKILTLSYHDLPFQLKHCFPYMGSFPEDADIPFETSYQLWIVEGMVLTEDRIGEESMMELTERYLEELGHRRMVQLQATERPGMIRKFSSCRLHDLMRDFCLLQAEVENFLKSIRYSSQGKDLDPYGSLNGSSICKPRRLTISLDPKDVRRYVPPNKKITKYLRMFKLVVWYPYRGRMAKAIKSQLKNFNMLHSLSIEGLEPNSNYTSCRTCDVWKLPKAIGKLIHLRYLGLKDSYFVVLPSSIGNLKHLLTLDLRLQTHVWSLPNILYKLKRLVFLYLPSGINMQPCKLRLHCLNKLEVLVNFRDDSFYIPDLLKLTNLRVIEVYCMKFINMELVVNYTKKSDMLQQVTMNSGNPVGDKRGEVLKQLLFGKSMCYLKLDVSMWKFPEFESNNLSSDLVELEIHYRGSDEKDNICETVEKFPQLRVLFLGFLRRREMVFRAMGFPQLRELYLRGLPNLERWVVEKGAMPKLCTLYIWDCPQLEANSCWSTVYHYS